MSPVRSEESAVFHRFLDLAYPSLVGGKGVWLRTAEGAEVLDACSGGAMAACLGHGREDIASAWAAQAERLSYVYDEHFANEAREALAERVLSRVAPGMWRVRFVSGGSEANEAALRLARQYHVERGEPERWRVVSPAQAYHGSTMGTLALSGRPRALHHPFEPYLAPHLHIPPSTWRFDPSGEAALEALDAAIEEAGEKGVAAFFCEPVSAAALPGYSPPTRFWEGLAERRERHGFLVCFDEVVAGMGRVGSWLAADQLPIEPDIVTLGKGLGAGYAPIAAVLCRRHVVEPLVAGSGFFDLGHTWDGAPLSCAVGLAVLDVLERESLVERVASDGPGFRAGVEEALRGNELVREVRGRGFLVGIELVDPRDGESILPDDLDTASLVDDVAFEHGLLVTSTHAGPDGYTGDEVLLAPAYNASGAELEEMVRRLAAALGVVERRVKEALAGPGAPAPSAALAGRGEGR